MSFGRSSHEGRESKFPYSEFRRIGNVQRRSVHQTCRSIPKYWFAGEFDLPSTTSARMRLNEAPLSSLVDSDVPGRMSPRQGNRANASLTVSGSALSGRRRSSHRWIVQFGHCTSARLLTFEGGWCACRGSDSAACRTGLRHSAAGPRPPATIEACFAYRRRLPIAISDSVVRGIDRVEPKSHCSTRLST
jgi:hypothetical protein